MSCLFCAVVAGDIPSRQVYADEHAYAFLDINPFTRGHTLVVPRRHVDDVLAPDEALIEIHLIPRYAARPGLATLTRHEPGIDQDEVHAALSRG